MAAEYDAVMEEQGEEPDGRETTTNPLLLPVVLDILCNVCDLSDLKRFRLVCKPWYNHSLRRWRNSMMLCVSEDYDRQRLETDTNLGICNTKALIDDLPEIRNKPYRHFNVRLLNESWSHGQDRVENSGPTREDYEAFWKAIGPMMVSLRFDMDQVMYDWKLSPWFIEKTPNLESLELGTRLDNFFIASEGKLHPKLTKISVAPHRDPCWCAIMKTFPNLVDIILGNSDAQDIRAISDAMRFIGEPNRKMYLLGAEWGLKEGPEILDLLMDLRRTPNLKFAELGIELVDDHLHTTRLIQALHSTMAQTLEYLHVLKAVDDAFIPVNRVFQDTWPQLQHLVVAGRVVQSLNFLQATPNLSSLKLEYVQHYQLGATLCDEINKGTLDKLKILTVYMKNLETLWVSDIMLFAHLAPNLSNLEAPLGNMSFRAVCTLFKDIRHLTVYSSSCFDTELDDEGITGIVNGDTESYPNIRNLKYLYSFRTNVTNLSDLSINEGFLKMQHLYHMDIPLSSTTSDAALAA